jgi:cyclic beta-1,2-glucan synthetase
VAARQLLPDRGTDRTARRHLPARYGRELPRLADGPSAALPRVYDIALETISHGDGRLDTDALGGFVSAYQSVTPLTIGELWAIPIMLRLALIENLRRVAARLGADRGDRSRADYWADQMTAIAQKDPKSLILSIADMARSDPPMVGSFVAEFARRLQGKGPALALPLTWIEQRLAEDGRTIEQLVQSENQQQAADQVSISNSISSLRFLGAVDWRAFVEARSGVERTLREDPAGVYPLMDFATRDQYRHAWRRRPGGAAGRKARWPGSRSTSPGRQPRPRTPTPGRCTSASTWLTRGSDSSNELPVRASRSPKPFGAPASTTRWRSISEVSSPSPCCPRRPCR